MMRRKPLLPTAFLVALVFCALQMAKPSSLVFVGGGGAVPTRSSSRVAMMGGKKAWVGPKKGSYVKIMRPLIKMAGCPFQQIVKETTGAVAPHVRAIVDDFYPRMFANNPETKAFFNTANQFKEPPLQRMALANAVVAYAQNIETLGKLSDAIALIAHKHCGLGVQAQHYPIVHDNLMGAIGSVLTKEGVEVTDEIAGGWSKAVLSLADVCIAEEAKLYDAAEKRSGGWRGVKDFKIAAKRALTDTCTEFTFVTSDGKPVPIDFTSGQFLTVHLKTEKATPRHYTITSAPGQPHLQCCVKAEKDGMVSNALHALKPGSIVGLSPPFGVFSMQSGPAVLVSSGIGVTPMKSFLESAPERVKLALHVDRSEASHPFRQEFMESGVPTSFHYTDKNGRPSMEHLIKEVEPHLSTCDFYLCGSPGFLNDMHKSLTAAGAKGVHVDVFGPALAS